MHCQVPAAVQARVSAGSSQRCQNQNNHFFFFQFSMSVTGPMVHSCRHEKPSALRQYLKADVFSWELKLAVSLIYSVRYQKGGHFEQDSAVHLEWLCQFNSLTSKSHHKTLLSCMTFSWVKEEWMGNWERDLRFKDLVRLSLWFVGALYCYHSPSQCSGRRHINQTQEINISNETKSTTGMEANRTHEGGLFCSPLNVQERCPQSSTSWIFNWQHFKGRCC